MHMRWMQEMSIFNIDVTYVIGPGIIKKFMNIDNICNKILKLYVYLLLFLR